ncbi:branched-chain amino acid ABC transporter permease [Nonomuraea turcica]|uniref:branched-chain amino acid ABC transporter permease n=1 Tax=Nonomuraea sp. G32 TaxID=3067274 RepID=UPI00273C217C|nr:branched-chain amino acid ABC transporter permease [Nonomuraea sp. G32]MDP4502305.1 branched-chain amino acid ABC transporter permease [Nonomuraea sp. G32]
MSRRILAVAAAAVLLLAVPVALDSFSVFVASRILILGLFATAYNVVFGYGGMPSLGHAAFFGIGGYTVGIAVTRWAWPMPLTMPVALVLGAVAGAVFGLFCLRVRGVYLLLITLALAQAVFGLAFYQTELTGGDNGIPGIPRDGVPTGGGFYLLALAVTAGCVAALWAFQRSPAGMTILGMRESESRMSATGYQVATIRVMAFAVSGAFSAVAGALEVYLQGSVSTASLSWQISAEVLVFAILGGARRFLGPFLGAAIVTGLEVWVSTYTDRWTTVLGVVYILTALFLADGVLGRSRSLLRRLRRGAVPPAEEAADESVIVEAGK